MAMQGVMSIFRRIFPRNYSADRAQSRYECRLDASLTLVESDIVLKGVVLDIAIKGALFRPDQKYLLKRDGTLVRLKIGEIVADGEIVNTTTRGYGIQFKSELRIGALQF